MRPQLILACRHTESDTDGTVSTAAVRAQQLRGSSLHRRATGESLRVRKVCLCLEIVRRELIIIAGVSVARV